ncbi:MAG TPA: hypothetical protein VIY52_21485, partial [Streptosporangiaceae bacterium]
MSPPGLASYAATVSRGLEHWPDACPNPGIACARRWCEQRVPDDARDQVRVECDIGVPAPDDPRVPTAVAPGHRQRMGAV